MLPFQITPTMIQWALFSGTSVVVAVAWIVAFIKSYKSRTADVLQQAADSYQKAYDGKVAECLMLTQQLADLQLRITACKDSLDKSIAAGILALDKVNHDRAVERDVWLQALADAKAKK